MAEELYNHWRNLTDLTHLRAEIFKPGEEKVLTIKEIIAEKITSNTGVVEERPVAHFEEDVLPMVLNVTNCKTIEKICGTGNVFNWVGKKIQVFATTTKVAGQSTICLRIRPYAPKTDKVEYHCCVCNKVISKEIHDGSIAKYGKSYCSKECLDKDKNGEDIL